MSVTNRQLWRLAEHAVGGAPDKLLTVHLGALEFHVERGALIDGAIHLHIDPDLLFNAIAPLLGRATTKGEL